MNLEKYTQKSQEALLAAQGLAQEYQHQTIEPIHLLLALVKQEDGTVPAIVTKVSGGTQALQEELTKELAKRPKFRGLTWTLACHVQRRKSFPRRNGMPKACRTIMFPPSTSCWD